ncbi:MAG: hypothetical protein JXA25_15780 [Anaerolineales bacterium]|nr:hypothetical protein [Anaerolineales bacterium]
MVGTIQEMSFMQLQFPRDQNPVFGKLQSRVLEELAEKTGFDTEELDSAFKDGSIRQLLESAGITREDMEVMRTEAVEEMQAAGEITESQAKRLAERPAGPPPPPPPPAGNEGDMASSMTKVLEQIVSELGLESTGELLALLPEGTSLWSFAEENGVNLFSSESNFDIKV